MISSNNPHHRRLVDVLNNHPKRKHSQIKKFSKTFVLATGLIGVLFWNIAPQWMEYILWGFAMLAWMFLVCSSCVAAPLWCMEIIEQIDTHKKFERVCAQLKILDPSLRPVLEQIDQDFQNQDRCTSQWQVAAVEELHKHQKHLENAFACPVDEEACSSHIQPRTYKNLQL